MHNGIIENFQELRDELTASGCTFRSDTDTEVLACLIEEERKRASSLLEAFARALRRARGAYAVAMISPEEPETVYAARLSAPLLIGVGAGECFVASDIPAFLAYTRDVVFLEDGEIARVGRRKGREGGTARGPGMGAVPSGQPCPHTPGSHTHRMGYAGRLQGRVQAFHA